MTEMTLKDEKGNEYQVNEIFPVDREQTYTITKIQKPKIVDLSSLVGNTRILFEFSDDKQDWIEGYLFGIFEKADIFIRAHAINNELTRSHNYKYIRFSTRQWYFHDGKSPCPIPIGVSLEVKAINMDDIVTHDNYGPADAWLHNDHMCGGYHAFQRVIAYRIKGLLPGWSYQ